MSNDDYTLAELCITASAEVWRDDGEVLATGIGVIPRLAASLAKASFNQDLMMTDGEAYLVTEPVPPGPRNGYEIQVEAWMPYRRVFENLWSGKRHAMVGPTQIDRYGQANISCIGDYASPKAMLLGVRGFPGNTIHHPNSFFIPNHGVRVFVEKCDMVSSVGNDPAAWGPGMRRDFVDLRRVVSNLGVFDFQGPDGSMRLISVHPESSVDEVRENTGFELTVADDCGVTAVPTSDQLQLIRETLDPNNQRANVFPS
ncbi:ketoacid CoA transferase [Myxococcota bacterium]|nr:ketoacid CoA transferase [Myxococcota bacterium]